MTVIGFLLLAAVFGVIGLAVLRIVPLYMERMKVRSVLGDLQTELSGGTNSVQSIRNALESRLYIESLSVPRDEIQIAREGDGYVVRIVRESRAPFVADLSFVVDIDEQIELGR
jgi:hypothetical protein